MGHHDDCDHECHQGDERSDRSQTARRRQRRVAAAPAPCSGQRANSSSPYRPTSEEPSQLLGQFLRRGVSLAWLFLQALQANGLQVARNIGVEPSGAGGLIMDDVVKQHADIAAEGPFAGKQLEEDDAQRIHVRAAVRLVRFALGLFR